MEAEVRQAAICARAARGCRAQRGARLAVARQLRVELLRPHHVDRADRKVAADERPISLDEVKDSGHGDLITPGDDGLQIRLPHLLMVGDQEVDLSHFELLLDQPTVVDCTANEDGT